MNASPQYILVTKSGTVHYPDCPRLRLAKEENMRILTTLPPIGKILIFEQEQRKIYRDDYKRKGYLVRGGMAQLTINHTSLIRKHCRDCFKFEPIVPIGYRMCFGPLHPEGKTIRMEEFRKVRPGKLHNRCRDCEGYVSYGGIYHGYVPVSKIIPFLDTIIETYGIMEASRRIGVHNDSIRKTRNRHYKHVRKETAVRILKESYRLKRAAA